VRRPLVVAHRGGRGLAPENTLLACARALRLGVDAIEIDVRLTADAHPVVLHDATLDRTTTGRGPVTGLDAAAVRRLDATVGWHERGVKPQPPPLLTDVLALVGRRAALHVELKGDPSVPAALVERVVALLRPVVPPPLLLSFDWAALRLSRELAPWLATEPLLGTWPAAAPALLADLTRARTRWLGIRYGLVSPSRVVAVHAAGSRLNVWTVNRVPSLRRALRLNVDAITTDRPDRLLSVLASN
jgi:glycerophosphoryl diester phosphodiesterase